MKKDLATGFDTRQYMQHQEFELFYYKDINPYHISSHTHEHYECFFFLEGDVDYQIGEAVYHLESGDFLMIPPHTTHRPLFSPRKSVYRRFVLWLSPGFYQSLCHNDRNYSYGFDYVKKERNYHFRSDFNDFHHLHGMLLELLEESRGSHAFSPLRSNLKAASFLVELNRIIYNHNHQVPSMHFNVLYLSICDYINNHLGEDLSLETLASFFYVSKYHISHIFKEHMGLSLHQYILKKRLYACRNEILSNIPLTELYRQYGFNDYSSFYRAFKKEFGQSPSEYREQHRLIADEPLIL